MRKSVVLDEPCYEIIAARITDVLRREFGEDAKIGAERGYGGRVRVQIVSSRFNSMTERQKQECVWDIARNALGADAIHLTFILAYGTDERVVYPFDAAAPPVEKQTIETETIKKRPKIKQPPYEELAAEAVAALHQALGADAVIETRRGYRGRVQIDLLTPRLNNLGERQKQDILWQVLDDALGEKTTWISFILGYGTDEGHPTLEYEADESRLQQTL